MRLTNCLRFFDSMPSNNALQRSVHAFEQARVLRARHHRAVRALMRQRALAERGR